MYTSLSAHSRADSLLCLVSLFAEFAIKGYSHSHSFTLTYSHTHTYSRTSMHMCTHTHTYMHTRTCTHEYAHTLTPTHFLFFFMSNVSVDELLEEYIPIVDYSESSSFSSLLLSLSLTHTSSLSFTHKTSLPHAHTLSLFPFPTFSLSHSSSIFSLQCAYYETLTFSLSSLFENAEVLYIFFSFSFSFSLFFTI